MADLRKTTIKQIQVLTGFLNFLTKAIHAGHTFTRHMYAKCAQMEIGKNNKKLKAHHHVLLDSEFRFDCNVWKLFLTHYQDLAVCRPMIDWNKSEINATQLTFSSDTSKNTELGFGAVFENQWTFGKWEPNFVKECDPSIEYLELFGVVAALLTWGDRIKNKWIAVYCDNMSVVGMINNTTSSCRNCMYLLRLLVLNNLVNNRRVFVRHITSKNNFLSDALSRLQFRRFWRLAPPGMSPVKTPVSPLVWPISKIWQKY